MKITINTDKGTVVVEKEDSVTVVVPDTPAEEKWCKVGAYARLENNTRANWVNSGAGTSPVLAEQVKILAYDKAVRMCLVVDAFGDIAWVGERHLSPSKGKTLTVTGVEGVGSHEVIVNPGDFITYNGVLYEVFGFYEEGIAVCFPHNYGGDFFTTAVFLDLEEDDANWYYA